MGRLILTHATGEQLPLLGLIEAHYRVYARGLGYDLNIVDTPVDTQGRSPHWAKIILIRQALTKYETVVWLDADIVIRTREDVAGGMQPDSFQGLVMEQGPHGIGPNTGVWILRRGERADRFLEATWNKGDIAGATLHEQAAVASLMGFSVLPGYTRPIGGDAAVEWLQGTTWIDRRWNMVRMYHPESSIIAKAIHYRGLTAKEKASLIRAQIVEDRLDGWHTLVEDKARESMLRWP